MRRLLLLLSITLFVGALPACGPAIYVFDIIPASSAVGQAEQAGAEEWAPYHYWLARLYLEKAAEEANEANYQDAIQLAERSREHAELAQQRAREARRAGAESASSSTTSSGGEDE